MTIKKPNLSAIKFRLLYFLIISFYWSWFMAAEKKINYSICIKKKTFKQNVLSKSL